VIEIAPGVEITMLRRGIMEVLPDDFDSQPAAGAEADDGPADEAHAADETHAEDAGDTDATEDVSAGDSGDRSK
jgi:hypothetical protein